MQGSKRLGLSLTIFLLGTQILGLIVLTPAHGSNPTFGSTINLSNDPASSETPLMAAVANDVYAVWLNNTLGDTANYNILLSASHDHGSSFGPLIKISNSPTGNSINPAIAAVGSDVYVVWQSNVSATVNQIFFTASTNNGTTFGPVINVSNDALDSSVPEIAAVGSNVYVAWLTATSRKPAIDFKASTTNGSNLGTVTVIQLSSSANTSQNPQVAASGNNVYVTWEDDANTTPQTFFSRSTNNGGAFTTAVSLSKTVTGETDINQKIVASGSNVFVAWTNFTLANQETMFAASTNNGQSFSGPANLSSNPTASLNPKLAATNNNVYVIWTQSVMAGHTDVFYRGSNNNGTIFAGTIDLTNTTGTSTISTIVPPNMAAAGSNVYVTWDNATGSNNDVFLISSSDNGKTFGKAQNLSNDRAASEPVVAVAGTNAYVVWLDVTAGNGDIFFRGTGATVVHDVAVSAIVLSRTFAYSGISANPIIVNVTAANLGTSSETFYVGVKANSTLIGNQTVTLAAGASSVVTFSWITVSLVRGNYILTAHATPVPGETILSNNNFTGGTFAVRLKGDVNGDCRVDVSDLSTVGGNFGKTLGIAGFNPYADLNNDGVVDIADLVLVASAFGQAC